MLQDEAGKPFRSADYGTTVGTAELTAWVRHDRMWISRKAKEGAIPGAFRSFPGSRWRFKTGPELDNFVGACLNRSSASFNHGVAEEKIAERVAGLIREVRVRLSEGQARILREDLEAGQNLVGFLDHLRDDLANLIEDVRQSDQPRWF